jgi:putative transposase
MAATYTVDVLPRSGRRYLGLDALARSRMALINTNETTTEKEDETPAALTA